ncbi:hypothetical protein ACFPAG_09120 [Vogesella sp. GCM10023246]|uniref:Uncharacterized protein n=1 Tax=Vogesella oryzagri TaxID=3160864 RepID=A0ABV1M3F9_9NEIS
MEQQLNVNAWDFGPDRYQLHDASYRHSVEVKDKFLWLSASIARMAVAGEVVPAYMSEKWHSLDELDDFCRDRTLRIFYDTMLDS